MNEKELNKYMLLDEENKSSAYVLNGVSIPLETKAYYLKCPVCNSHVFAFQPGVTIKQVFTEILELKKNEKARYCQGCGQKLILPEEI